MKYSELIKLVLNENLELLTSIDETEVNEEVTVPLTVYKYMFNCTNIDYHKSSGKIKTMTFEYEKIQKNPDGSNSQFYWQYD